MNFPGLSCFNTFSFGFMEIGGGYSSEGEDDLFDTLQPEETKIEQENLSGTPIPVSNDSDEDSLGDSYPESPLTYSFDPRNPLHHSPSENNSAFKQQRNRPVLACKQDPVDTYQASVIDLNKYNDEGSEYSFNPLVTKKTDGTKIDVFNKFFSEDPDTSTTEYSLAKLREYDNRYNNILTKNTKIYAPHEGLDHGYYLNAVKYEFKIGQTTLLFIATQAPLKTTFVSFFKAMIIGGSKCIVNLAMLYENGRPKCDDYWSDEYWHRISSLVIRDGPKVIATLTKKLSDVILKTLESPSNIPESQKQRIVKRAITCSPYKGDPYNITQIHFENWPDHGTPDPTLFGNLLDYLNKENLLVGGPLTVHCSAGVGRTGTLIGMMAMDKQIEEQIKSGIEPKINPVNLVKDMRLEKDGMVQSKEQWLFMHSMIGIRAKTLNEQYLMNIDLETYT